MLFSDKLQRFIGTNAAIVIIPVFILITPAVDFAQEHEVRFDRISIEQNLSQSSVRAIFQDSRGFMWFGTEDGLNKYDGYRFLVYTPDPNDPYSFSSNFVRSIFEDREGSLWIGTNGGGLNRFDRFTERFYRYKHDPDDPQSLGSDIVWAILQDSSGNIWLGTEGGGLNRFDRETETFIRYRADPDYPSALSHDFVRSIVEERPGVLWVGTQGGGLCRFNTGSGTFTRFRHDSSDSNSLGNDFVYAVYKDESGAIWIGTGGGLDQLIYSDTTDDVPWFRHYPHDPDDPESLSHNTVLSVFEDRQGTLWVGTEGGGLNSFNRKTGKFRRFRHDPNDPESLSNDFVLSIYEDRSGVLWIGTETGGVNKINREKEKFVHLHHVPNSSASLSNKHIWSINEDEDGRLFIGTRYAGFDVYDRKERRVTNYRNDPADPNSLSDNWIRQIYRDRSGTWWIGTHNGGLNKFDEAEGTFVHYQYNESDPHSISNNTVYSILEDEKGVMWVGTRYGGLNRFDRETGRFTRYLSDPDNPHSLSHNFVYKIYQDRSGVMWIGTFAGGLDRFDPESGRFYNYHSDINDPTSLSNDTILTMYEDSAGVFWVGTGGGGLNRFDRESGTSERYHSKNSGIPNDIVYAILEDSEGNLWLSTNQGISKFNPSREEFKNYDSRDGLQSNEFNGGAYFKSSSGELFFGGINGITAFYPEDIRDNPHVPPIVITRFLLFDQEVPIGAQEGGREILSRSITETDEIVLTHEENFIAFEYAALDFTVPEKNRYVHKLVGFDKAYQYTHWGRRYTSYKNLDPGEYVFRVWGSNNDDVWNEEGASIRIIIAPPFWDTWWFRLPALIVTITLLTVGYRTSTRALRERNRRREREKREMEIARDIQRSMLPAAPPVLLGAEIAVMNVPAMHVGGDFYTFIEYNQRRVAVIVGDIVGKGVPGALNMAATISSLEVMVPRSASVAETMNWLNIHLVQNTAQRSFAAVFFAVLDLDEMTMQWCNAGLPEPVIIPDGGEPRSLEMPLYSLPPGASRRSQYRNESRALAHGETLVLLTDGVLEARRKEGDDEEFGYQRLLEFLKHRPHERPDKLINSLIHELQRYQGKAALDDDFTVVVVKID